MAHLFTSIANLGGDPPCRRHFVVSAADTADRRTSSAGTTGQLIPGTEGITPGPGVLIYLYLLTPRWTLLDRFPLGGHSVSRCIAERRQIRRIRL